MAFITEAQMKSALTARFGGSSASFNPAHWDAVAPDVVESGYNTILSVLGNRGFTPAQIAAWDRGAEFNRRIGFCHFLRESAPAGDYDGPAIDRVCECLKELETVTVTVSGVVVMPSGDGTRVGYGTYAEDDNDRHNIDNTLTGL